MDSLMKPLPADEAGNLFPPFDSYPYVPRHPYIYFENAEARPFAFTAIQFEKINACWLSDAAMLAYSNEARVRYSCEQAGFNDVVWYPSRKVQCFVAIHDNYVFVAFAGVHAALLRLQTPLVEFGKHGAINRQAKEALDEVWETTPSNGGDIGLAAMLDKIGRDFPQATLWLTGHGFGGAVAALAAQRLPRVAGLYTFGAPMVGDRLFQRTFEVPAWRFVNSGDLIARLPVFGRYRPFRAAFIGKYHAVGDLRFIDANGIIRPVEVLSGGSGVNSLTYLRAKFGRSRATSSAHAPLAYAVRIWNDYAGSVPGNRIPMGPPPRRTPLLRGWFSTALRWSAVGVVVLLAALGGMVGLSLALRLLPEEQPAYREAHRPRVLETGLGADRQEFYSLAEGSEVFPRAVADAARQPGDARAGLFDRIRGITADRKPFLQNLERYGFIPIPATIDNPYGYVGLTVNKRIGTGMEMIGVNCAACHVGQIEYKGKAIRVDGAPNMLDIFRFFGDLADSVTSMDIDVLLREIRVSLKSMTREGLEVYIDELANMKKLNQPGNTPPLPGRADAFGTARAMFFADFQPLTAPASYPHIWGFEHTAWYHWNANTNSVLERNLGQALGLGGGIDLTNCKTTIDLNALDRMERLGYKIGPPVWPEELGPIDQASAVRGRAIYMGQGTYNTPERGGCAGCHEDYKTIQDGEVTLKDYALHPLSVMKTDPNEAWNSIPRVLQRGDVCEGNSGPIDRMGFGQAHEMLLGRIRVDLSVQSLSDHSLFNGGRSRPVWRSTVLCEDPSQKEFKGRPVGDCPVYPSKPHLGVWATAPYLHNGSVPTLWDMLKPPDERPKQFNVGHREYDPVNVGYVQTSPPDPKYPIFDTTLDGNKNSGHPFGIGLADTEKRDLIEFLKSITPEIEQQMHTEIVARSQTGVRSAAQSSR